MINTIGFSNDIKCLPWIFSGYILQQRYSCRKGLIWLVWLLPYWTHKPLRYWIHQPQHLAIKATQPYPTHHRAKFPFFTEFILNCLSSLVNGSEGIKGLEQCYITWQYWNYSIQTSQFQDIQRYFLKNDHQNMRIQPKQWWKWLMVSDP